MSELIELSEHTWCTWEGPVRYNDIYYKDLEEAFVSIHEKMDCTSVLINEPLLIELCPENPASFPDSLIETIIESIDEYDENLLDNEVFFSDHVTDEHRESLKGSLSKWSSSVVWRKWIPSGKFIDAKDGFNEYIKEFIYDNT